MISLYLIFCLVFPVVELRGEATDTVHVHAGGTLRLSAFVSVSYFIKKSRNSKFF